MTATAPPPTRGARTPFPMRTAKEKRDGYLTRLSRLKADRGGWDSHWSELGRHILPRSARFSTDDRNRPDESSFNQIYDNAATRSVDVLSAGIMSNLTSPSARWYRRTTQNPDLREDHSVRLWLDEVEKRELMVLARSNAYRVLPNMYEDLGVFGTAAALMLFDFENLVHLYPLTVGEFCLQQDYQGRITTCYREFQRTVGETVTEFGYENCSVAVQQQWENRQHEGAVEILHVIEPRVDQDRNLNSKRAIDMPWRSIHIEKTDGTDKILRESGFKRMRVLAPRWQVRGGDVYGSTCPGMVALGDIKSLQHEQLRKAQGIDYQTKPPLQVPQSMKDRMQDMLPNGLSFFEPGAILPFDQVTPGGGIRNAFQVELDLNHLLLDIGDVRVRIEKAFHHDLFLLLATQQRGQMTAFEVGERKAEALVQLGPTVGRMTNELHTPMLDILFEEMFDAGAFPPPPPVLQGQELTLEFLSILAQAQKAAGVSAGQAFVSEVIAVAETIPDVVDNVNFDKWARGTADQRGIPGEYLVEEDQVDELRAARAQRDAAQEQTALGEQQAGIVKDLSAAGAQQQ